MATLTPFLWLEHPVDDAVAFYRSIFPDTKVTDVTPFPPGMPSTGTMTATVTLLGQAFTLFSGGPHFRLNEAFSIFLQCDGQAEVDQYWDRLLAGGGVVQQCGWLKDRFGLSWQVIPRVLGKYMADADPVKAQRVVQAMLKMKKIDVAALDAAYRG